MRTLRVWVAVAALATAASLATSAVAQSRDYLVYFGTYTRGIVSKGIYAYRFQPTTGTFTSLGLAVETSNPAFLVAHPSGRFLYSVNEQAAGTVSAFAIDRATGRLTLLNKVSSRGDGPCHVSLDKTGRFLFVANYGSGSIAVLPVQQDGRLGEATSSVQHKGSSVDRERQTGPHAHFITSSPDNRFVLTADLGLDQVLEYRFDPAKGTLAPNSPPFATLRPGSGPRHLAFHPTANYIYVNGEMSSTLSAFAFDPATGTMKERQTLSTLPVGFSGTSSTAEVQVDRAGRFVYVSNRGDDSIAIFAIDRATGTLTPAGHAPTNGRTPRYFTLDPSGNYLIAGNQGSNTVEVFRVDAKAGGLAPAQTLRDVPEPVSIVFVEGASR
jgi:6-phosphogluconolactonase